MDIVITMSVVVGVNVVHVWFVVLLEVEQLSQVLHNSSVFLTWLALLWSLWLPALWLTLLWLLLLFNWSIWVTTWSVGWIWFVLLLSRSFPFLL